MNDALRTLPSVDRVLHWPQVEEMAATAGHQAVTGAIRAVLTACREAHGKSGTEFSDDAIVAAVQTELDASLSLSLKPVFNLTGTVLHTNLGRAPLPEEAIAAMIAAAGAANLEFDLESGRRGDRNSHVERWICRLTGAEAAVAVNNNAAAVLLTLNSLANRKQVPVSRGELIEIGGAFRIPEVMTRAGCKLVEVGATNRTHLRDYADAITQQTALLMKVHTSNYEVQGFSSAVSEAELATLAQEREVPLITDLGSGTLIDMARYGLPPEPTVQSMIDAGADLVTFSGDKLLGGPQAGLIAGKAELVKRIRRNPMMRALRLDKVTLAALGAVLRLYADPDRLAQRLPTLRLLTRDTGEIERLAATVAPEVARALDPAFSVDYIACKSQIGSGALPVDRLPSFAVRIATQKSRGSGKALLRLAAAFRVLPVPVVGRVHDGALLFDLRCLEDEAGFVKQLNALVVK